MKYQGDLAKNGSVWGFIVYLREKKKHIPTIKILQATDVNWALYHLTVRFASIKTINTQITSEINTVHRIKRSFSSRKSSSEYHIITKVSSGIDQSRRSTIKSVQPMERRLGPAADDFDYLFLIRQW